MDADIDVDARTFTAQFNLHAQRPISTFLSDRFSIASRPDLGSQLKDILAPALRAERLSARWSQLFNLRHTLFSIIDESTTRIALEQNSSPLHTILSTSSAEDSSNIDIDDILDDLWRMETQLSVLSYLGLSCPVAHFDSAPTPVLLSMVTGREVILNAFIKSRSGDLSALRYTSVSLDKVASLMADPLSYFLGIRLWSHKSGTSNDCQIEVENKEDGWQVIYSRYLADDRCGFGGPTTPVSGTIKTGAYRFGIASAEKVTWDNNTIWNIPRTPPHIYLPLP